jgi:regulator of protease activity HflC (stomatin/prohibitin superfamily)
VNVKHTVLYRPQLFFCEECGASTLSKIHRQYGPDYANLLISPAAQSWIRKLIGVLTPEEIFMRQKGLIERNEKDSLGLLLKHSHIDVESYFIKSIVLPDSVNFAIESKFRQQQLNEEYTFKIQVEEKELKRKEIEAFGIRRFQEVSGVSPVQWKALDVTQSVATSPNTKVVISGGASGGLPIFLGDQFNMKPFNSNAVPPLPKDSIKR